MIKIWQRRLLCSTVIAAGLMLAMMTPDFCLAIQGPYTHATSGEMAGSRGLDGSSLVAKDYNCEQCDADNENQQISDPDETLVTAFQCGTIPEPKNQGHPCIDCPTIGQSIKVQNGTGKTGYIMLSAIPCDSDPSTGTKGTCTNGRCVDEQPYGCPTFLEFYGTQLPPP